MVTYRRSAFAVAVVAPLATRWCAPTSAGNLLIASQGLVAVEWPWACRGAAFIDLVPFARSIAIQGEPTR
jgi:hypothetical protein